MRVGWRSPLGYIRGFRRSSQDRMSAQPGFILCRLSPLCCSVTFPAFGFALLLYLYTLQTSQLCSVTFWLRTLYLICLLCSAILCHTSFGFCTFNCVFHTLQTNQLLLSLLLVKYFLGALLFPSLPILNLFLLTLTSTSYPSFIVKIYFSIHQDACFQNCFVSLCGSDGSDHLFCTCYVFTVVLMPLIRTLMFVFLYVLCVCVGPDPHSSSFTAADIFLRPVCRQSGLGSRKLLTPSLLTMENGSERPQSSFPSLRVITRAKSDDCTRKRVVVVKPVL